MASEQSNSNGGDEKEEPLYKKFIDQKYPSTSAQENSGRHGWSLDAPKLLWKCSSHQNSYGRDSTGDQATQGTQLNNQAASNERVDRKVSSRKAASDKSKARGFDYEILWLEKQLLKPEINNDQMKAIGIFGIAGVGKTRLCQEIFDRPDVKKHFLPRIWVSMAWKPGEDSDPKVAFLKRILVCLGLEKKIINDIYGTEKIAGLEYALHLELLGKRYLIVLDDVREEDKFCESLELCYGFPKGFEGAVIVTSRSEELAKKMVREENLHRVLPLSDMDHCWGIYKDMVESDKIPRLPDSDELKAELLRKCNGIPLAAKLMGQIKFQELQQRREQQQQQQPPPVNGLFLD